MGIQITEKDVGRRVLLRNRTVCTITDYYRGGKWPVRLDNGEWVMNSGFFTNTNSPGELDVVSFVNEVQEETVSMEYADKLARVIVRQMTEQLSLIGYSEDTCNLIFCRLTDILAEESLEVMVDILDTYRPNNAGIGPQASRKGEHE